MDLNRAATFVKVVETGGFTRAAEAAGLPPSSISRSVAKLEEELGVVLLERTTRRVALTEAGRAFFERAREALAGLEEANSLALDAALEAHGLVRIALPVELGTMAGAMFAEFLLAHPRIRIETTFTNRGAELVGDLVDLAMVAGKLPDSSLVTRRLGDSASRLFASPAYVERRGTPRTVADLAKHDGIFTRAVAGEGRWELTGPRGADHVHAPARIVADHTSFMFDAAKAGLGIALLPGFMGDPEVAAGRLVALLPKHSTTFALHVLTHGARHLPRRVALVRDYLVHTMGGVCHAHGVRA